MSVWVGAIHTKRPDTRRSISWGDGDDDLVLAGCSSLLRASYESQ